MKHVLISSYPNREIRVTIVRSQIGKKETYSDTAEEIISDERGSTPHLSFAQNSPTATERPSQSREEPRQAPGHGGLPRHQRFSVYGRRTILHAGGALERTHGHKDCLFLTVTHPGSTVESFRAIAEYSAYAVQGLQRWLSNHIPNKLSIYTWEWQKRGALHLHMVLHVLDRERGEWIRANLKTEWIRILDSISDKSGVDVYRKNQGFSWVKDKSVVRVDAQWCEKSVAAYLSKYVSKATESNKRMPRNAFYPSRWYGVSRPLLQLTRELTFKVSLDSLRDRDGWDSYEDCLSLLQSYSLKCYEYSHKVGDGKTIVSYVNNNEQDSIWMSIMDLILTNPDSLSNTEKTMRRLARNGSILIKKHKVWLETFMHFSGNSRCSKLLNLPSYKDISRNDLTFLVDSLAYAFRYTQRTRYELPGECQLWYSQMRACLKDAPSEDKEWIGALEL